MKKIVLCNGDSLGMPRPGVRFADTWFYKLSSERQDFLCINNFKRALNTSHLYSLDFLENYQPDYVILQVGIVDCAPRLFSQKSVLIKFVNSTPAFFSSAFWKMAKKLKKRKISNADVPLKEFSLNLKKYFDRCVEAGVQKVVVICIQNPGSNMVKKNAGILASIHSYNAALINLANQYQGCVHINPLADGDDANYLSDGYHLSQTGFRKVWESILRVI